MKHDATSIPKYIDTFTEMLQIRGCKFDDHGFPILDSSWFVTGTPTCMTTYRDRHATFVQQPEKTLLCFYCADKLIYPRFDNLVNEIPEYKQFLGVVAPDLTVTEDMDISWQREIILANQLFEAMLGINGVKIVQNLRIGSEETLACMFSVPANVPCATGTLGCNRDNLSDGLLFSEKLYTIRPSILFIYGKHDSLIEEQLNNLQMPYRLFRDAHTIKRNLSRTRKTKDTTARKFAST